MKITRTGGWLVVDIRGPGTAHEGIKLARAMLAGRNKGQRGAITRRACPNEVWPLPGTSITTEILCRKGLIKIRANGTLSRVAGLGKATRGRARRRDP